MREHFARRLAPRPRRAVGVAVLAVGRYGRRGHEHIDESNDLPARDTAARTLTRTDGVGATLISRMSSEDADLDVEPAEVRVAYAVAIFLCAAIGGGIPLYLQNRLTRSHALDKGIVLGTIFGGGVFIASGFVCMCLGIGPLLRDTIRARGGVKSDKTPRGFPW